MKMNKEEFDDFMLRIIDHKHLYNFICQLIQESDADFGSSSKDYYYEIVHIKADLEERMDELNETLRQLTELVEALRN
jgi:hypothetical protein